MPRCFVIQPFDKGQFDKRYDDVFVPAIEKAGMEPYRVDRDPFVTIPIETIEEYIRESDACLADITLDNPNVWYEVGFAYASRKDTVMVCSEDRLKFPFDVKHRTIVTYATHAPRDFTRLESDITIRLKAFSKKLKTIQEATKLQPTEGLDQHEMVALIICMEGQLTPDMGEAPFSIQSDMERAGHTKIAATLALESLRRKGLIELSLQLDDRNNNDYQVYKVTELGIKWLLDNKKKLVMIKPPTSKRGYGNSPPSPRISGLPPIADDGDDDIPF